MIDTCVSDLYPPRPSLDWMLDARLGTFLKPGDGIAREWPCGVHGASGSSVIWAFFRILPVEKQQFVGEHHLRTHPFDPQSSEWHASLEKPVGQLLHAVFVAASWGWGCLKYLKKTTDSDRVKPRRFQFLIVYSHVCPFCLPCMFAFSFRLWRWSQ